MHKYRLTGKTFEHKETIATGTPLAWRWNNMDKAWLSGPTQSDLDALLRELLPHVHVERVPIDEEAQKFVDFEDWMGTLEAFRRRGGICQLDQSLLLGALQKAWKLLSPKMKQGSTVTVDTAELEKIFFGRR